jgi:cytochrome c oxidase accessory protein FixG
MCSQQSTLPILDDLNRKQRIASCPKGCGRCEGTGLCPTDRNGNDGSILSPDEIVLPTLSRDGKRRWIQPSLAPGRTWYWRRWVAAALVVFFVALPHLRINGKPYVLLDIASREFTFLGHTFYPTDTPLLACIVVGTFLSIMLATSIAGRVWCGWGCPQTVYMEFLFRPIDRLFAGTIGKGGTSRKRASALSQAGRIGVYLICCLFLTHTFLSYFVGTERLAQWILLPPTKHPVPFLIMAGTTAALMFHFLYFREQLCLIACPYGRFQSVMLDRKSLIVSYDSDRGEPRKKGKREKIVDGQAVLLGDCVDCGRCTSVCPMGIDIRNGLQLECIHCAQCVDACAQVMTKLNRPIGLIRYTSQDALVGKPKRWLRVRPTIYSIGLCIVASIFFMVLETKFAFDARLLRMPGAPFVIREEQVVQNNFRLRLVNRSQILQRYTMAFDDTSIKANWSLGSETVQLDPGESKLVPIDVLFPSQLTAGEGSRAATLTVSDTQGAKRNVATRLLGPR